MTFQDLPIDGNAAVLGLDLFSPQKWGLDHYSDFDMEKALPLMNECWPLVIGIIVGYVSMVFCVKPLCHPYWDLLRTVRHAWNTGLAVFSLIGSIHVVSHLAQSVATRGLYTAVTEADETFLKGPTGFWMLLFILGKIVELGDTVLLLLSGKSPSFLHWFHHTTVLPWSWHEILAKTPMNCFCMAFNYSVHSIMYGYFALNDTFDDPAFRRRWGTRITFIQCTQFALDLIVFSIAGFDRFTLGPASQTSVTSLLLSAFIIISYLVLFLQFAEEKYGFYSQFRHALYLSRQKNANNNSTESSILPWHRPDLSLDQRFDEATKMAVMLSYVATMEDLMAAYGAYKQVKDGPMPALMKEPASADEKARAKWRAWDQARELSKEEAQLQYIQVMDMLAQRSEEAQAKSSKSSPLASSKLPNNAVDALNLYPVKIAGHGAYLPQRVVYNDEVEARGGFALSSQEKKRTGVRERRWADVDGGENLIQNGAKAVRLACAKAGVALDELDLIIGGFGGHQFLPDDAVLVQRELGLGESGIRAFTVHATCLSFLVAMDVAGSFMRDGRYRNVAVFASSVASVGLNAKDAHTAGLFGDGAAAVVLQPSDCSAAIHRVHMETFGCGTDVCKVEGGGTFRPSSHPKFEKHMDQFKMDGEKTLALISKFVRGGLHRGMPGLERGLTGIQVPGCDKKVDIDWVVPHQASAVGISSLGMFGWPEEKILKTIHKFGNVIAASIPLTLCDGIDNGTIKRGDKILLCGTSAGVSFGAMLLTY